MAESLNAFTIDFDTEGMKAFSEELKYNKQQLDLYEKKVKELEAVQKELSDVGGIGSDVYKENAKAIEAARKEANRYRETIDKLQKSSKYSFMNMQKSAMKLIRTLGMFVAVRATIQKSLQFYEQAEQLDFLAQKTGITTDKLQELANAAKRFGGTTEGTATSVENIRTNKEEYTKAGIRVEQDPAQTLENVARKMEKLKTDAEKWKLADTLGIDEATTRMLIEGVEKYRENLQKSSKYKLYTKEDIQRMRDYRQIQQDIRDGTQAIFGTIYRSLLPAITAVSKIIRGLTDFLVRHEGATKIVLTLTAVAAAIGGIKLAIWGVNAALAALEAHPTVRTLIVVTSIITGLILAIQDMIVWLQGGEAALSGLWEKISKLGSFLMKMGIINPQVQYMPTTTLRKGQETINKANNNPMNAVPAGAVSTYYNSQSQNENNNQNSKNIANNRTNKVDVGSITINTQASDPKAVANTVKNTLNSLDNGQLA